MTSAANVAIAGPLLVGGLLAGCGGSSGGGMTHQALHRALKAATCMRANRVPNYPDPKLIDGTIKLSFTASISPRRRLSRRPRRGADIKTNSSPKRPDHASRSPTACARTA